MEAFWGVVAQLGHVEWWGYVEETTLAGVAVLKVSVPGIPADEARAELLPEVVFVGSGSLFSVRVRTEAQVLDVLRGRRRWLPPSLALQLTADAEEVPPGGHDQEPFDPEEEDLHE